MDGRNAAPDSLSSFELQDRFQPKGKLGKQETCSSCPLHVKVKLGWNLPTGAKWNLSVHRMVSCSVVENDIEHSGHFL